MNTNNYLNQLENAQWQPITDQIWDTIQIEGLDEEFNQDRTAWSFISLNVSQQDSDELRAYDPVAIDEWNGFDISLKEKFNLQMIDLIDYANGSVIIVKHE
jgi:hypothetical protein